MIFLQNHQQLSSGNKSASFYSSCTGLRFEVLLVHLHLNLVQSKQNLSLLNIYSNLNSTTFLDIIYKKGDY
jgi:hypothetical protein